MAYFKSMRGGTTTIECKRTSDTEIGVILNQKRAGVIRTVADGFQYVPIGHKQGGAIFPSISAVKRSLED